METRLAANIAGTTEGKEAESILRACVHCGFCNATCPTYQLLGDELDGPRGRIYLIKQLLEGQPASAKTQLHLDRCLTCRSCETTCPSGVNYHRLLDIGRHVLSEQLPRPMGQRVVRRALAEGLSRPALFSQAVRLGQWLRPLLPAPLMDKLPASSESHPPTAPGPSTLTRRVLMLAGCVQPALAPSINIAARQVLAALGIAAIEAPKAGCCGAVRFHLDQQTAALKDMRQLIDHWWPFISNQPIEAIIVTASGCGAHLKDYGKLLEDDKEYAEKAARISALCRDIGDYLIDQTDALAGQLATQLAAQVVTPDLFDATHHPAVSDTSRNPALPVKPLTVAVHTPCTLQHALKRRGDIERLLTLAGYALSPVTETHLCCGSAGTYSITQPELSTRLRDRKLDALLNTTAQVPTTSAGSGAGNLPANSLANSLAISPASSAEGGIGIGIGAPECIVTANIGCLNHLQSGTALPVKHWIELVAERLKPGSETY